MTSNVSRQPSPLCGPGIAGNSGFTLLEILIALSLTAMLSAMLTAGVYGVIRDWDNNAGALESTLDQTVALLQLERALLGAFPHSYRDPDTLGRHVYFDGENNRLSWVSSVSPQRNPGLTAWHLYTDNNRQVMLQLAPALSDYPGDRVREAEPVALLNGYELEIRYLFEDLQFQRLWRDEWSGMALQSLPLAVHIRLIPDTVRGQDNAQAGAGNTTGDGSIHIIAPIHSTRHRSIQPMQEFIN